MTVLHPAALPEVPPSEPYPLPPIQPYHSEPQVPSTPAPYFSPYHHPYPLPPMSPIPAPHSPAPPFYPPQSPYMPPPLVDPNMYYSHPDPAVPQYYLPLRPSSVEPTPSHPLYQMPSGLPPVHQPLVPLMTGVLKDIGREAGKGERASRISQHLRISSRHRSVSPQAHRYHNPSLPESHPSFVPQHHITVASHPSYPSQSLRQQPGSPNLSVATNVISPRPMLSPKQSFTIDPVTHATLSKSDRVKALERIAALAVQDNCDMSNSVPPIVGLSAADKDKTLPAPPVPSQKPNPHEELRPRVDTLFPAAPISSDPPKETPRTPTIAAVTSLKVPRTVGDVKGGVSGLDALEARLLAEVGTRKMELDDKKPDVRSIMPIAIPRPIAAQEEPANESAISSLTLPGVGADELTPRVEKAKSTHSGELHDGEITERGRRSYRSREDERVSNGAKGERRGEKKSGKRNKDRHGEHNDGEIQHLRKAAQGRIAAWLGAIDPTAPPQSSASPSPARSPDPAPIRPEEPPVSSEPMVHPFEEKDIEEGNTTLAQPNPRSSGFVPVETLRLTNQRKAPPVNSPSSPSMGPRSEADQVADLPRFGLIPRPVPGQRYDIRSARGGRGGKVTAVAAIWASAATTSKDKGEPTPKLLPAKVRRPVRRPSKEQVVKDTAPNIPHRFPPISKPKKVPSKEDVTTTEATPVTVANLSSKRARMVKSTSVPAIVSSSLATPMLSSTASLARPPVPSAERTKLDAQVSQMSRGMRSIPEGKPEPPAKPPEPKVELAFGQARLRELIKRYQGQSNA